MTDQALLELLARVQDGTTDASSALTELKALPYDDLGFAKVDYRRELRNGFPEVIFCPGKTGDQIAGIARSLADRGCNVLATRAERPVFDRLVRDFPGTEYHPEARIVFIKDHDLPASPLKTLIVTGGTSDIPVAEEAAVTSEKLGYAADRLYDVGVAGLHRLLDNRGKLSEASVIIVVAGMEGALASVVCGLTDVPVIAVPTSVGYGASFGGLSALLSMLNSCASGMGVVNIDNGFGAGYLAATIARQIEKLSAQARL